MTSPRWLSAEEQRVWRAFLEANRRLFEHIDRQLQRDTGIPLSYYDILARLSEAPNRTLRMSALADCSHLSRSRLSHAVARLEEAGWVRRTECPTDRRGLLAVLTDEGYAALAAAAPAHVETVRGLLFDALTVDQVAQLGSICEAVVAQAGRAGTAQADGAGTAAASAHAVGAGADRGRGR